LGLLQAKPTAFLQSGSEESADWIQEQIKARAQAKLDKDFKLADSIRSQLLEKGVLLKDSPTGTTWEQVH
jgi:cysteinyl-tRNA synthetase